MTPSDLFADSARSSKNLRSLYEAFIASGSNYSREQFSAALTPQLHASPDPDMALTSLLRFIEASVSKASLFNDLVHYPVLMEVLMKVFGSSRYFADILVRDPELFRWLTASDSFVAPRSKGYLTAEVERALTMFQKPERKLDALRRLYRREILRAGTRDILGEADLPTVTGEISLLADSLIDAACRVAEQQLAGQFPEKPKTPYAVIGLGKLGGAELNYSSDIDIIFVYGDEGELLNERGKAVTYHEYFNRFVEKTVQNLSQSTMEGHLYRVDTRLRPESGAGPLARSLRSYLLYYESRGELWERQMLIKARPVAGNAEFGSNFLQQLAPFIYPRTFFQHPAEAVARIKAKIENAIEGSENVKLRSGGIRDIEFTVQTLQLLHGGKNKSLRSPNTLGAITQLESAGLMKADEAQTLQEAYRFFRTLEHRLQFMLNTQTHDLPEDVRSRDALAKRMGLKSAAELLRIYQLHTTGVRLIFEQVLAVKSDPSEAGILSILEGGANEDVLNSVLTRYGFEDKGQATRNLASLARGKSLTAGHEHDARTREAFREIAPKLLEEIARSPVPDMTLSNMAMLAATQQLPEIFYRQLREEGLRKFVLRVCGISPIMVKGLAFRPGMLEQLAVDLSVSHENVAASNIIAWKNEQELCAGVRHILGLTSLQELTNELAAVADTAFASILDDNLGKFRKPGGSLAVFALGKYGSREILFNSDLDIIFVSDAKSATGQAQLEKLATRVVAELSRVSEDGTLYRVDARLRPEGKSAPLVVERTALLEYLRSRASLWERQSLTRLRFVCGDKKLGSAVESDIDKFVFGAPLPADWVGQIVDMRKKMETRSRVGRSDYLDIKLGSGGMVDVEFLTQMLMLKKQSAGLRGRPTVDLLHKLEIPGMSVEDVNRLSTTYELYRNIEKLMRITLEEKGVVLPEEKKLDLLARCHDGSRGVDLRQNLGERMKFVRQAFLAVAGRL